ncbi:serine/threonine protein kinase [Picrophilus oshimae DSM 9789]|uniref:non-specific serine/threonine protein kinase n=2 Tax=Picrophilus oshimae TaxID=46632 RepID=A0A8G2FXV0_PICTO|nr:serine/threonine protein kinase [Picrophilus oshimae DSM 9789]
MLYFYNKGVMMDETFGNNRYSVIKKLGEGGKGIVYKCIDNNLNRIVALKLIKSESLDDESYSRIIREAETTARLSHPNIVSIYDMQKEDNRFFMVIEYIDGKDLLDYIDNKPLKLDEILSLIIPITSALSYAHKNGVLHRDIKPENIMVSKNGEPKLMDFGLAKALDRPGITRAGTIVGTPAYLSPESALGRESDNRSDLYSLGCVLYYMSTGRPPFTINDTIKLIYSHIHDYPAEPSKINKDIPRQLDSIIMKLLRKNPDDRFQSADELLYALKALEMENRPDNKKEIIEKTDSYKDQSMLIGLDSIISELQSAVDSGLSGSGSIYLITGESGQGKTRILEKTMDYAVLRGTKSILLKGRESRMSTPNYLFTEMFREFFYEAPQQLVYKVCGDYGDVAVKILPELISKLGRINDYMSSEPDQARLRFYDGVIEIIKNMSIEYPVLMEIDDINYADSGSLSIIDSIMDKLQSLRFVIIATMSKSDSYNDELDHIISNRILNKMETKNLDRPQTAMLIASRLNEDVSKISDEFTDFIFVKTDGNPFYIEEVLKLLKDKKLIFRDEHGSWDRKPIEEIGIPSSIGSFIKERLSSLDDITMDIISMASVIGYEFDVDVLESISGIDENQFEKIIENSIKRKIVYERKTAPGEFRLFFSNPQLHDYLYENMSMFRKRKLHAKIANAIESIYGDNNSAFFRDLARHYLEAGNLQKALDYNIKLADNWSESFQFDQAVKEYRRALEILGEIHKPGKDSEMLRANLLYKISENAVFNNDISENDSIYLDEAIRIFDRYGEDKKIAESILISSASYNKFDYYIDYTRSFLNRLYENKGDPEVIGIASTAIIGSLWYTANVSEARKWGKKYIDYVRSINYYDKYTIRCKEILLLVHPLNSYSDLDDIIKSYEEIAYESTNLLEKHPDDLILLNTLSTLFNNFGTMMARMVFDLKKAEQAFDRGIQFAGKISRGQKARLEISKYEELFLSGNRDVVNRYFDMVFKSNSRDDFYIMVSKFGELYFDYFHGDIDKTITLISELEKIPSMQVLTSIPEVKVPIFVDNKKITEIYDYIEDIIKKIDGEITGDTIKGYIITLMHAVYVSSIANNSENAIKYLSLIKNEYNKYGLWWIGSYMNIAESYYQSYFGNRDAAKKLMNDSALKFHEHGFDIYYGIYMYELAVLYHMDGEQEKCNMALDSALSVFTPINFTLYIEKCLRLKELLKA